MAQRKPVSVGRLSKRKRAQLEKRIQSTENMKYRDRCRAILWSADGKSVTEIAALLGVHRSTAHRWVKDYMRFGLEGLEIGKQSGRPRKADIEVDAIIRAAINKNPHDLGYTFTRWTAVNMSTHIEREAHVHLHPMTVRRAM